MDGKKISFGFKPKLKPGHLISLPIVKKPDHELIECLEGSSIKIIGKEEEKPKLLVIPLKNDNNATKRIAKTALKIIKEEQGLETSESDPIKPASNNKPVEPPSNETLDQKAAREIIASVTQTEVADETKIYSLPITADELPLDGASESTIDDYENIPIRDFGLAMLRGMGWKDEEKKANELKLPPLRPKGMGLGADKLAKAKELLVQPAHNEVLEIKKNAYVKIITGKHKNLYGQIEGLDDDSGRINVVLSIGGSKISLNEFTVQVVTKEEWLKYGKILNSAQYDDYKNKDVKPEIKKEKTIKSEPSSSSLNNKPSDREVERYPDSKNNRTSKSSTQNDNSSSRRNYSDNDENGNKTSSSYDKRKQSNSRSTSSSKYYQHKSRRASSGSSDGSDLEEERRGNEKHKMSAKSKKSSHDRHIRSRSKSRERHRRHSSEESSDDQKYHHKKKTKKSKKPRSRSRTRR